jgi:hypothetical protein
MTPVFSPWAWLWGKVCDFYDYLCWEGRWVIPADTRKRMVINCKCPTCGLTQLVGGIVEHDGTGPDPYRRCAGCPTIINYHQHRVGDWEIVS